MNEFEFRDKRDSIVTLNIPISNFYSILYTTYDCQHREPLSLNYSIETTSSLICLKSRTIKRMDVVTLKFFEKENSRWLNDLHLSFANVNLCHFIGVSCNDVPNSEYSENVNATIETRANNWVQFVRVVRWWCWPLRRVGRARNGILQDLELIYFLKRCGSN